MRAFLAIPLPAAVRAELAELAGSIPRLRALKAETIHLTLRFLGEITSPEPILAAVAPVVAAHEPFEMELRGLGGFPRTHAARVAWVGVRKGDMEAGILAAGIEDALVILGFPRERRPWHGHVTLGRFRVARRIPPEIADKERDFGLVRAERVVLFRSTLSREGAFHEPVWELSLGGDMKPGCDLDS